jgi:hypothetical protein
MFYAGQAAFLPVVRYESSAEKAAREQTALMKQQNVLLATLAGHHPAPPIVLPPRARPGEPACCVECIHQGCHKGMEGNPGRTYRVSRCCCKVHH